MFLCVFYYSLHSKVGRFNALCVFSLTMETTAANNRGYSLHIRVGQFQAFLFTCWRQQQPVGWADICFSVHMYNPGHMKLWYLHLGKITCFPPVVSLFYLQSHVHCHFKITISNNVIFKYSQKIPFKLKYFTFQ